MINEADVTYETITYEQEDSIAIVTLNRPERLNAWTDQMNADIVHAIDDANEDKNIGAVVVTGAGRGFCAGADIKDTFQSQLDDRASDVLKDVEPYVKFIRRSKPIVGAVNGVAVGVGATMLLPFDVIVASEEARIGFFFLKMGVTPELASSHFLVQRVGFGVASEMCLTARLYSAAEVHERGLTNYVVPADELLDKAKEIAREIAVHPARQLRMVKSLLTANGSESDINKVNEREKAALDEAYASAEHKEAVQAFIEKREPNFRDL